jgi:hypothetical protein
MAQIYGARFTSKTHRWQVTDIATGIGLGWFEEDTRIGAGGRLEPAADNDLS